MAKSQISLSPLATALGQVALQVAALKELDYLAYITAVAAFGGLVLGVFNTWKGLIEEKVKLKVTASLAQRDDAVDFVNSTSPT